MIIFFYGEDTFRSRTRLREQVKRFKEARDPFGYNVVFLNGKTADVERVRGELVTAPFLAEKRMVVIDDILSLSDKKFLADLIEIIKEKKIPESTVVIFWQGEKIGKTSEAKELFELLRAEKYAEEFSPLTSSEVRRWAMREVEARGGKIQGSALDALIASSGNDMWFLDSTLSQLVSFSQGKEIQQEDVRLFAVDLVDENVFALVDAIVGGKKQLAVKLLAEQRRIGLEDGYLFAMLVRQFRILLQLRAVVEEAGTAPSDVLAKKLSLHPFVVKKSLPIARQYAIPELSKIFRELLAIDEQAKTGRGDQSMLIDMFIAARG